MSNLATDDADDWSSPWIAEFSEWLNLPDASFNWIEHYKRHRMRQLGVAETVFVFALFGRWLLLKAYDKATNHRQTRKTYPK